MRKQEIIKVLKSYKQDTAAKYGLRDIGIFGSVARDEAGEESDVDIVVHITQPDLFMLAGIKDELEERLHRPIDIITYGQDTNQFLRKRIDSEAVYA